MGLLGAWPLAPAAIALGVLVTLPLPLPVRHAERRDRDGADERSRRLAGPRPAPSVSTASLSAACNPGFIAGEDFIFQDRTGLIAVDFRSMLGLIGNLFAGCTRVPKHFDKPGDVTGWFRRGIPQLA